jgi:pyruvate dehydrogenase E2 component (dihydrolipoamide acetyltransferase)
MAQTMRVPELGENIESVDVVRVLVAVGDTLALEQPVIEVETDKASVEVPATVTGVVTEVHVAEGDTLAEGDPILTVDEKAQKEEESADEAAPGPTAEDLEPAASPRETGTATASERQPPPSAEERPAPGPAETEEPSTTAPPRSEEPPPSAPPGSEEPPPSAHRRAVPASPRVRRFARELGVDVTRVQGSGPGGRILVEDVKEHTHRALGGAPAAAGAPQPTLPDFSAWGPVRREPMSKVRRLTAEAMARAWTTVPQVTQHDEADISELEELRARFRDRVEAAGGKLTVTAILVKVLAAAAKVFPKLNASIDTSADEVVFKESVHVGVAVDTDRGLLVPVIRDADRKSITTISRELDDLARRARDRKLQSEEMQGATITISNLGGIGGTAFTPIVNWPQVAILGVSRGRTVARFVDGAFVPRLMLPLSLSYDHRLVDGADAARFLRWVAEALEEPLLLALEG